MAERATALEALEVRKRRAAWVRLLKGVARFVRTKPLGAAGAVIVLVIAVLAIFAPTLAPYDPLDFHYSDTFRAPSRSYFLGTDNFGRDLWSRIIYGARPALLIGLGAVALGSIAGALLGLLTGYVGGALDLVGQRFVDLMIAFPVLLLAIAIVAAVGPSTFTLIVAIAVAGFGPGMARIIRSSAVSLKGMPFVEAARAIGCTQGRVILVHLLPNAVPIFLVVVTGSLGSAILIEASLSFLGLGTPPPHPSWGNMLGQEGREYFRSAPWVAIFPGLFISLTVLGFNILGDAIRDVQDPRLRKA